MATKQQAEPEQDPIERKLTIQEKIDRLPFSSCVICGRRCNEDYETLWISGMCKVCFNEENDNGD